MFNPMKTFAPNVSGIMLAMGLSAVLILSVIIIGVLAGRLLNLPANMGLLAGCAVTICGACFASS